MAHSKMFGSFLSRAMDICKQSACKVAYKDLKRTLILLLIQLQALKVTWRRTQNAWNILLEWVELPNKTSLKTLCFFCIYLFFIDFKRFSYVCVCCFFKLNRIFEFVFCLLVIFPRKKNDTDRTRSRLGWMMERKKNIVYKLCMNKTFQFEQNRSSRQF